ncbi:methylated-DNA--[protein]-cysteine S-methyltransferase [Mycetocola reblochoni]|nr:methylated-DNA--[protein]-cysteine S-methyltransferase [Mycetocola reblochoni]
MTTPLGVLLLTADEDGTAIAGLSLRDEHSPWPETLPLADGGHPMVLDAAAEQIARYLRDPGAPLDIPVSVPTGTSAEERRVWESLTRLPARHAIGVSRLATRVGLPRRTVESALDRVPVPLLQPRHRVLGAGGLVLPRSERHRGSLTRRLQEHERIPSLP